MRYSVVIPAYNEHAFLADTLNSLLGQSCPPHQLIVVDDQSTDGTFELAQSLALEHPSVQVYQTQSVGGGHQPGAKVIQAFLLGYAAVDSSADFIVKADADLIFPPHYFETLQKYFSEDPKLGMAGGCAYIEKEGQWVLEKLTDPDHIRGAFKTYRKACYEQIGGLQPQMGWDTVDEMLARYFGWELKVDMALHVKHLKPTGASYTQAARYKQGAAFYALGYGFLLTSMASLKLASRKGKPLLAKDYVIGFFKAKWGGVPMLVNADQARFIRGYRYKNLWRKVFATKSKQQ
ncbi:MAG: glycosyl transferase family 2 [Flavobacterium sp. BFFFF2]|nr:MAG: glycosyl transferase family 2 [Flavobacterium sp. BFFFF2]